MAGKWETKAYIATTQGKKRLLSRQRESEIRRDIHYLDLSKNKETCYTHPHVDLASASPSCMLNFFLQGSKSFFGEVAKVFLAR